MTNSIEGAMPPLPEPNYRVEHGFGSEPVPAFTADQMHAYARDAQYAAMAGQEPVGAARIKLVTKCSVCEHCCYDTSGFYECSLIGKRFSHEGKSHTPPAWCPLPLYPAPTNPAAQEPQTAEQMRPDFEWWWVTRGVFPALGTREAAAAWGAWLASGGYKAPGGWVLSDAPWGWEAVNSAPAAQERAEPVAPAVGERNIHHSELLIEMWPPRPTKGMIVGMSKGVKITHKPTGLYVTCDSERSQHANRDKAYEQLCIVLSATPPAPAQPSSYGHCPQCGAKGVMRERSPNGKTTCANGHEFPHARFDAAQPSPNPSKPEQAEAPSDAELNELAQHHTWFNGSHAMTNYPAFARAAIARWGATLPPAIAAGERERAYNAGFVEASRIHGAEIESLRAALARGNGGA